MQKIKKEIWKNVIDYDNLYQVSNIGNIKSITRNSILKGRDNGRGYLCVALSKNNKLKNFKIHKLVAIHFLGHIQSKMDMVINHIDGNYYNNYCNNLEIVTQRENVIKYHQENVKSSIYVGVCKYKDNKWRSTININNDCIHLGYFENEAKAGEMYNVALDNIIYYNGNKKNFREYLKNKICQNM